MAINMSSLESTLQSKFNAVTDPKEMLLLGKAYEATVGGITVTDVADAGAAQVASINSVATSTFKTVGGSSILGSGDIATLPSQSGASGKALVSNGTTASWGSSFDELSDVGFTFDSCGGEGSAGPSANYVSERYLNINGLNSSNLNVRQTSSGNQVITIQEAGKYLIMCAGASGGGIGGQGGVAWGQRSLSAGDTLYLRVGQKGMLAQPSTTTTPSAADSTNLTNNPTDANPMPGGGFGDGKGGQGGGSASGWTASGGGGSAVRLNSDSVSSRIIVAGGGGGEYAEGARGGQSVIGCGGDGGGFYGLFGDSNSGTPPQGGTQVGGGGAGNGGGNTGTQAQGGNGPTNDGGGGGGGYWGGGSGVNMAGAGGSGYIGGMDSSARGFQSGGNAGNGWILIRKVA